MSVVSLPEKVLYPWVAQFFRERGLFPLVEKGVGDKRVDVAGLALDLEEVGRRLEEGHEVFSIHLMFSILQAVEERGSASLGELQRVDCGKPYRYCGYSRSHVLRVVRGLRSFLAYRRGRVWLKRPYRPYARELVVAEVKVRPSDWAAALAQLERYGDVAHRLYLALPEPGARRLPPSFRGEAERMGVGLMAIKPDGEVVELIPPRRREPRSPRLYARLLESAWRTHQGRIYAFYREKTGGQPGTFASPARA